MARKEKSKFSGKVKTNAQESQRAYQGGYLILPSGVKTFTPPMDKRVYFDHIPYVVKIANHPDRNPELGIAIAGELWWKLPFKVHRNVGGDDGETVVCPTTFGLPCPICEYRAKLIQEGEDDSEKLKALRPKSRNLYLIKPVGKSVVQYGSDFLVWDVSPFLYQDLLTEELQEHEEFESFPDLEMGYTLGVRFAAGSIGGGKPFPEASRIDFEKREKQYDEATILPEIPCLDRMLYVMSYTRIHAKFFGMDEELSGEEREETSEEKTAQEPPWDKEDAVHKAGADAPPEKEENETSKQKELEPGYKLCVACGGTGKNTKGKTCRICKGDGVVKKEEEEEAPTKPENPCPHGHIFGKEFEEHEECNTVCEKWDACCEAS